MKIWQSGEEKGERYLQQLEARYARLFPAQLDDKARRTVAAVAKQGDKALVAYVRRLDLKGRPTEGFRLHGTVAGGEDVGEEFVNAVELALANLKGFHEPQAVKGFTPEGDDGLGIRVRPIESLGVYVADGSAASLASLLTAVVPARIAGVSRIAVATPPRAFLASPQLRYLLDRLDLREIYLMGGAHAVAALAYGTDSVAPVDKIVGAGGRMVAAAKRAVCGVVGVDAAADPYEMVIVADARAEAEIAAGDLLAAAGRDEDALAVLVTSSKSLAAKVERRVAARVRALPRKHPARSALKNWGAIVLVPDLDAAAEVVNRIAPQHVELLVAEPLRVQDLIERAGMVSVGPWSPPALADLVLGGGLSLPAAGGARFASPLGVWDFVRRTVVARAAAHRYPALARAAAALAPKDELHEEALRAGSRGTM
ncbi:MAG: histidinol dehydrogenase [Thermoanaerobaculaceae bacterium]|nr:histidinol dehydrogenase [Thermoanaerobaculaceae bacterium]